MGQLITVSRKPSIRPDVAIFELNRSLTGMGHERYTSAADAGGMEQIIRDLFTYYRPGVEVVEPTP